MLNDAALQFWNYTGYTRDELVRVMQEVDDTTLAVLVDFNQGSLRFTITSTVERRREGHFPTILRFIKEIDDTYGEGKLKGSIILWLEDGMWDGPMKLAQRVPIMAFGRRTYDACTMLIPDPAYLGSQGYRKDVEEINERDEALPWDKKQPTVFWRGAGTGCGVEDPATWMHVPRVLLCMESKRLNDPQRLDAALTKVVDYGEEHTKRFYDAGIVKDHVPFLDFLKYRYQVDLDGFHCAWMSLFLKLSSKCLVLKGGSSNIQWYYDRLVPWVHYIPLLPDVRDIDMIIDWIHTHDDECRHIASNAQSVARSITYEEALRETADLIKKVLRCQRG